MQEVGVLAITVTVARYISNDSALVIKIFVPPISTIGRSSPLKSVQNALVAISDSGQLRDSDSTVQ